MSLAALVLILVSAGFHATWNALVKVSRDKQAFLWLIHLPTLVVILPFFLASASAPIPPLGWAMIGASALIHVLYSMSLGAAYASGDLSLSTRSPAPPRSSCLSGPSGGWASD